MRIQIRSQPIHKRMYAYDFGNAFLKFDDIPSSVYGNETPEDFWLPVVRNNSSVQIGTVLLSSVIIDDER